MLRETTAQRRYLFLSKAWLDQARRLPQPDPARHSTIEIRLVITDPPPGVVAGVDIRIDLDSGLLAFAPATAEEPKVQLNVRYAAALSFLFGSPQQRVETFEREGTDLTGNFTLLFFADAALQQDKSGYVAAMRAGTRLQPGTGPAGTAATAPAPPPGDEMARLRDFLPRTAAELAAELGVSTPGVQLYVSQAGRVLADAGLGFARPGVPLTSRSLPIWYCICKPFVPLALGRLWEGGRFDPYRPIADYIPEFGVGGKSTITAAALLTHTGPIPAGIDPLHGMPAGPDEERRARAFSVRVPAEALARRVINYSPYWAWFVLAELIRAVDGRDHADYVTEELLRPCEARETRLRLTAAEFAEHEQTLPLIHVRNVRNAPRPTYWQSTFPTTTRCIPGVNTRGPMADLGKVLEALLAGGVAPGGRIIGADMLATLTSRHRTGIFDRYGSADWGLGFRVECRQLGREYLSFGSHVSPRAYGHDGFGLSTSFVDPDHGLVVVVNVNGMIEASLHKDRMLRIVDAVYADLKLA
ncbi:serine hydrolase domain-containing protein [Amycolatopsis sp. NPDC059021]|uniref:serine hydrolase domain-containing protein n=1 Tax=Amycolatopsis sp. NPDC059021 TaxID=3346704 RepID=UPI00366A9729